MAWRVVLCVALSTGFGAVYAIVAMHRWATAYLGLHVPIGALQGALLSFLPVLVYLRTRALTGVLVGFAIPLAAALLVQLTVDDPLWSYISVSLTFAGTFGAFLWLLPRAPVRDGRCPECGYPKVGLTSPVCPECGHSRP